MIVMAGIAEYGPWGGSATRWAAGIFFQSLRTNLLCGSMKHRNPSSGY